MNNIEDLIYETIDEINAQIPPEKRLEKSPETVIVGEGSLLDSLGIINFFVSLEEKVSNEAGQTITLLDEALGGQNDNLNSVAKITHYISEST